MLERFERLRLPARSVESEHQLLPEPLAMRVVGDERLELADELSGVPGLDFGLEALFEQRQAQLLEAGDLALRERLVRELLQRRPAPERERFSELACALVGRRRLRVVEERLRPVHVELARLDAQQVPGRLGDDHVGAKQLPELRDEVLERRWSGTRRLFAPERVDQPVGGDGTPGVEQEQREQSTLLRASELQEFSVAADVERTEKTEIHLPPFAGGSRAAGSLSTGCTWAISEPLAGRDRAVWTSLDGGRMATNTPHIPVRSARRCIVRSAVSRLCLVTAAAIATSSALALSGALQDGPELAKASRTAQAHGVSGQSFGYPIKPFDREHLIRANLGDPRMQFSGPPTMRTLLHGGGTFSFHPGVDIASWQGTAVYPVVDGTVTAVSHEWVRVSSGGGRAFEYWHIVPRVHNGQQVAARQTVLGRVRTSFNHVHLTEIEGGTVVNPLVRGRLTPYHDSTRPTVRVSLRRTDTGRELFPNFVRGRVEIVADAEDEPTTPGRNIWHGPVTPALITWQIRNFAGRVVVPERIAADFRTTVPSDSTFWSVYARGTYQNQTMFGRHYSYQQCGAYLFKLAHGFNTRTLRDGVYDLTVRASDIRGNTGSQTFRFTVHNRGGWR